ncbi:hypothetical protein PHISCL_08431 [Aspergillus sclerotialis]|uniref:DUF7136 domain-containing protein n=1 Tax=Aspergillus sclerotialis TaxID=2070753 RepID=A0A3A2ZIQ9_9EURO|nr:hypothetical protein PHISCL_08431 [Aspergillus sclerotialis]
MPLNTIARLSCLVACVRAAAAAALFGTTEIDLVFPRNDTFAPMPLLPVVFAVQNPPVSKMLWPRLEYGVGPLGHANLSADFHDFDDLTDMPSNDTSAYFVYTGVADRVNTEGNWEFWWRFRAMNCSILHPSGHSPQGPVPFSRP